MTMAARFNQDASYVALATDRGLRIHRLGPLQRPVCCCAREYVPSPHSSSNSTGLSSSPGGLGLVDMHYRRNLVALVGGGKTPKFSTNKVLLWDDSAGETLLELEFHSQVLNVKTSKTRYPFSPFFIFKVYLKQYMYIELNSWGG